MGALSGGPRPIRSRPDALIEWDNNIPPLETLLAEARRAAAFIADAEHEVAHADAA
jgi:uncharacterized protein (UPF0276 family)